jgi:hypothetical protein
MHVISFWCHTGLVDVVMANKCIHCGFQWMEKYISRLPWKMTVFVGQFNQRICRSVQCVTRDNKWKRTPPWSTRRLISCRWRLSWLNRLKWCWNECKRKEVCTLWCYASTTHGGGAVSTVWGHPTKPSAKPAASSISKNVIHEPHCSLRNFLSSWVLHWYIHFQMSTQ